MSLRPIAELISQQLSGIFTGMDLDNIQSSIWDGTLELTDLALNKARLNPKLGSVRILSSHVDKVFIVIPWKRIYDESVVFEIEGLNLQLLCDRSVPIDTLWMERVRLIEMIQESLRIQESLCIFSNLIKIMFRRARISVKDVMVNISVGEADIFTIRFDSLIVEPDNTMQDITSEAMNKVARLDGLSLALNGIEMIDTAGVSGVTNLTCNARIFQGSMSLNFELPELVRISIRNPSFLDVLALLFQQQKLLSSFNAPSSTSGLESLRIEYLYMLENPSPNWSERRRFIELSVNPVTIATWRRQMSRNSGINVRDLFSSISNIGSPDRTPPAAVTDDSSLLSGPLKIDFKITNCVLSLELPSVPAFSFDISKLIVSLVFPVGRNADEFTGRFFVSKVSAITDKHSLISFDMNMTVLRSIENGTDYDISLKHALEGFQLYSDAIANISRIIAELRMDKTNLSVDSVMENVNFLTKDVKESRVNISVDGLDLHVATTKEYIPTVFRIGPWSCSYSYAGGIRVKSEGVSIVESTSVIASIPPVQIMTDDDGLTSFFVAGPIEFHQFPKSLLPKDVEINADILDSDSLRLSHGLFYQIMKRFNLMKMVFNVPSLKIEGNILEHVQVDLCLSDEGFDIVGSTSSCEISADGITHFNLEPIMSKQNKVLSVRASHLGSSKQTPVFIESGPLAISVELPSDSRPKLATSSIVNLVEALKPMVDLDIPKLSLKISAEFDICKFRADGIRFANGSLDINKLDCELPEMESVIMKATADSRGPMFDPSDILPNFHVRELCAMGRFDKLNEDVVVGCSGLIHSGRTNYAVSHVFVSTEAGCIIEMRNVKANRGRTETVDGIVVNLSRQLVELIEGIIDVCPKPSPNESRVLVPYHFNISPFHFNFRDKHIISHMDLDLNIGMNFDFDQCKQVLTFADSSRVHVRKVELTELQTNTLVLRNDIRVSETLCIQFAGKIVIPLDEKENVQVNLNNLDLRNGIRLIVEDVNEIKRLFELLSEAELDAEPQRSVDLNCAIGIVDPIHVTAYSSGRPIISTTVQAGLVSVYYSAVPSVRAVTKVLIPEIKVESTIRNLKKGSWESLLRDCAFSLEVSDIRETTPDGGQSGSLKVNLTGLGDVNVGITPESVSCVRTLTESTRDTSLEATGSDTFHVVNLTNRLIQFKKESLIISVPPQNSAVVGDSIMMKDDDGIELINFRVLDQSEPPSTSSFKIEENSGDVRDWCIVDVTGSADILLNEFDFRIQIVYNIELNKKLIVFSFQKIIRNESEMPLLVELKSGKNSVDEKHKMFGVPFSVQSLVDGCGWFKTSRRSSIDDSDRRCDTNAEVILMHREAVSVSQLSKYSIKPYQSTDFGFSSPLPVTLPANGRYGLCCQPTSDLHAFPLYVRVDQSESETSGVIRLKPCGVIVNNLPCLIDVEVVSNDGILYIESEQIMRNSRRVLYNIDLSYCRIRVKTSPGGEFSDWSENIYFDSDCKDGANVNLCIRSRDGGTIVSLTYFVNPDLKSVTVFHPFWLSNCTDINIVPSIQTMNGTGFVESVQLGQEGLWYIQPEFDRKLNSMALTVTRPHTTGSVVSQEPIPLDGGFNHLTDSFCLGDPLVIQADTIRHHEAVLEVEPKLMDYTLLSVLPRFVIENRLREKTISVRQFGNGGTHEYILSENDKVSLSLSPNEPNQDIQFKITGVSRWSRFAIPLSVDGTHSLFVLSDDESEETNPPVPIPVMVKIESVRGITFVTLSTEESPLYILENRCPYIHSVIALAPRLRIGSRDEKNDDDIVFSPSTDDDKKTPIFFENPDRKVVRIMVCFDESSKFKEVELDISQFTNIHVDAVKLKESLMTARQPILVPCQGFPVVLICVVRNPLNPSQIVVAITPKDMGLSNWLVGLGNDEDSRDGFQTTHTYPHTKASIAVSLPRLNLDVCSTFQFFFDQVILKISKKRLDEFSINEFFSRSIIVEQTRSEEQVVFATVDQDKGVLATVDRVSHPSTTFASPISLSDIRVGLSPMELTVTNSVIDDIEFAIFLFREAWNDHNQPIGSNGAALIARSGTPFCLTVDVQSVLQSNKAARIVEIHDLRVSEILIHAWSALVYNRSRFISPEIRLILSILSLSDTLKLDGAEIRLPSEHIFRKMWRGPSSQLLSSIGDIYKKSLAENAASFSVVASSNVLNVVGGGLFRSQRDKQVIKRYD